jgi:hypothetical protein
VLETDPTLLRSRIEAAQNPIGQRVIKVEVEQSERREIVRTLNALSHSSETRIEIQHVISAGTPTIL